MGGQCSHGELGEEHDLPWFDRRDKDFEALKKVIQSFWKASSFYVRFMYDNKFSVIVITTAWSVDHQAGAYPCFHNKNCLGMGW